MSAVSSSRSQILTILFPLKNVEQPRCYCCSENARKRVAPPGALFDHRDVGQRRWARSAAGGRIILVEAVDQLGDLLEGAHQLDNPVGIISLGSKLRAHPVLEEG